MENKNRFYAIIYVLFILALGGFSLQTANAQNEERNLDSLSTYIGFEKEKTLITNNTVTFGVGSADLYDTYLSPLRYKGITLRVNYEQMRQTTWFDHRFHKQQLFEADVAKCLNPVKSVSEYSALLTYRLGGHYMFPATDGFRFGVGGLWETTGGGVYNERNGNNPASARFYSNMHLSAISSFKWRKMALRWQLDTPVGGIRFSTRYGQSYYEMSLGNSVGAVNFTSFHNQRVLRSYFTLDFAIGTYIVRGGYLLILNQTKINNLQTHYYTNSFVLGFPFESAKSKRPKAENRYWDASN